MGYKSELLRIWDVLLPLDDIVQLYKMVVRQEPISKSCEITQADCNVPTIGGYNNYHLSSNGIPSGNQRWYGLIYFVYK